MQNLISKIVAMVVGLDLGDKWTVFCVLDPAGKVRQQGRVRTEPGDLETFLKGLKRARVALEVGTHSPWVSRLVEKCGHEVLVANAREVRLIYASKRKSDKVDAESLARLARVDPELLKPIQHRGPEAQSHLRG